jgi:hypothetical protein
MRILTSTMILAAAIAVAAPASAQGTGVSSSTQKPASAKPAAPKPPMPPQKLAVRGFFVLDTEMMTATQSFKAITGSSTMIGYGGGGEVINLWKTVFIRGAFAMASASGERAYVIGGNVVPTGVGIDLGLQTIEIGGGWRLPLRKHPAITPYAGGSALFVKYTEDSRFASSLDNVNESFTGYGIEAGVDLTLTRLVYAAVEAQYRLVPNALGETGVSKSYNETDLGGFAFRVMVGVNLIKKK